MSEAFVHYVWQFQYFNKQSLISSTGEPVEIFDPGFRNANAGPDFHNARIRIGDMYWVGSVEIHIDASSWVAHHHEEDDGYDNVILHVVWTNDRPIFRRDGTILPAIELAQRVETSLLSKYKQLVNSLDVVACSSSLSRVKPVTVFGTIDKMQSTRLQNKAEDVLSFVHKNRGDWSESCYQYLARNYGFKVNADPFLQLAQAMSYKTLLKHSDHPEQIEAMLFGIAGFLDDADEPDEYQKLLVREFNILRQKYRLDHKQMNRIQWKFLRLRPANFPTIRIAQFASAISQDREFFSCFLEMSIEELRDIFKRSPSSYWQNHFHFSARSAMRNSEMGGASVDNIITNTVVPVLAAYSIYKDESRHMEKAISLLHETTAEENRVTRIWAQHDIMPRDAFDSQGLLELYNNYCTRHRCLDCNIGASLMKPSSP